MKEHATCRPSASAGPRKASALFVLLLAFTLQNASADFFSIQLPSGDASIGAAEERVLAMFGIRSGKTRYRADTISVERVSYYLTADVFAIPTDPLPEAERRLLLESVASAYYRNRNSLSLLSEDLISMSRKIAETSKQAYIDDSTALNNAGRIIMVIRENEITLIRRLLSYFSAADPALHSELARRLAIVDVAEGQLSRADFFVRYPSASLTVTTDAAEARVFIRRSETGRAVLFGEAPFSSSETIEGTYDIFVIGSGRYGRESVTIQPGGETAVHIAADTAAGRADAGDLTMITSVEIESPDFQFTVKGGYIDLPPGIYHCVMESADFGAIETTIKVESGSAVDLTSFLPGSYVSFSGFSNAATLTISNPVTGKSYRVLKTGVPIPLESGNWQVTAEAPRHRAHTATLIVPPGGETVVYRTTRLVPSVSGSLGGVLLLGSEGILPAYYDGGILFGGGIEIDFPLNSFISISLSNDIVYTGIHELDDEIETAFTDTTIAKLETFADTTSVGIDFGGRRLFGPVGVSAGAGISAVWLLNRMYANDLSTWGHSGTGEEYDDLTEPAESSLLILGFDLGRLSLTLDIGRIMALELRGTYRYYPEALTDLVTPVGGKISLSGFRFGFVVTY